MTPEKALEQIEAWLKEEYEHYMTKLEDTSSSNTAFDYLNGYTDHMDECIALVMNLRMQIEDGR